MDTLAELAQTLFDASPTLNTLKVLLFTAIFGVSSFVGFVAVAGYLLNRFFRAGEPDDAPQGRGPRHGQPSDVTRDATREASYREDYRKTEDWLDHIENRDRIAREKVERDARRASGNLSYCDRLSGMGDAIENVGDWMRGHFMPDRDEPGDPASEGQCDANHRVDVRPTVGNGPACGAWSRRPERVITARSGVFAGESVRVIGESGAYPGTWYVEGRGGRVSVLEGVEP